MLDFGCSVLDNLSDTMGVVDDHPASSNPYQASASKGKMLTSLYWRRDVEGGEYLRSVRELRRRHIKLTS
jgi:hypothetical protein